MSGTSDKTNNKYWCDMCKTFVYNNALSKQNHEASSKHKYAVQMTLRDSAQRHREAEMQVINKYFYFYFYFHY